MKGDLISHDKNKPIEVLKPAIDTESSKALESLNRALVEVDEKIRIGRTELSTINISISNLEQFLAKYELQAKQVSELNDVAVELAMKNNFTLDIAFTLAGNVDVFRNKLEELRTQKIVLQNKLDSHDELVADETHELLLVEKRNIEEQIRNNTLVAEDGLRKYQEYLNNVKVWQENRNKIEGNPELEGTIKFCEAELSYIENTLPTKESEGRGKIFEEVRAIYDLLSQKITVYKELYAPIEEKLSKILKDISLCHVFFPFQILGFRN